jgi:nucleoside 2-deoxyribosyltransferase
MKIYVASSWRNLLQPGIVTVLRECGHEVYDFRHPAPGNKGFAWSEIDPNWKKWTPAEYRTALHHPVAKEGYAFDINALKGCDACVLVLPSGRSASWEFGYAMGQGKRGAVVWLDEIEPELMYREAEIITSMDELFDAFAPVGHELARGA